MLAYMTGRLFWAYIPAYSTAPAARAGIAVRGRRVSANAAVTSTADATISQGPMRTRAPSAPPGCPGPVSVMPVMPAMLAAAAAPPTPTAAAIIEAVQAIEPSTPSAPADHRPV